VRSLVDTMAPLYISDCVVGASVEGFGCAVPANFGDEDSFISKVFEF
jgi:hypothetical protein